MVGHLMTRLKGEALSNAAGLRNPTYQELVAALTSKHGPQTAKGARLQLKARDQRKGESMSQFATAISKLVVRGYPRADRDMFNELALEAYIEGITDPHIRTHLRSAKLTTMEEAEAEAILLADGREAEKARSRRVVEDVAAPAIAQPASPAVSSGAGSPDVETKAQLSTLMEMVRKLEEAPRAPGGSSRDPHQGGRGRRGRQDGQRRPRGQGVTCWLCDQPGHICRECPLKGLLKQQAAASPLLPVPSNSGNGTGQL